MMNQMQRNQLTRILSNEPYSKNSVPSYSVHRPSFSRTRVFAILPTVLSALPASHSLVRITCTFSATLTPQTRLL